MQTLSEIRRDISKINRDLRIGEIVADVAALAAICAMVLAFLFMGPGL